MCQTEDGLKIFVMNIEAFSSGKGAETAYVREAAVEGIMVADESTAIKNRKANRIRLSLRRGSISDISVS